MIKPQAAANIVAANRAAKMKADLQALEDLFDAAVRTAVTPSVTVSPTSLAVEPTFEACRAFIEKLRGLGYAVTPEMNMDRKSCASITVRWSV